MTGNETAESSVATLAGARFYRPELDVLRLIAFCCVFSYHAMMFEGLTPAFAVLFFGKFGMSLFFVLSAYLITELLIREQRRTGTIHIKAFYVRRILRIWPLYFAFIAFCTCLGWFHKQWYVPVSALIAFASLAGNWYMSSKGELPGPVSPLWSISLEEQFYVLWPILAKFYRRKGLMIVSVLLFPVSIAATFLSRTDTWWNTLVQSQFFGVGALLALSLQGRVLRLKLGVRALLFCAGVCCWLTGGLLNYSAYFYNEGSHLIPSYELDAAGCVCLFLSILGVSCEFLPKLLVSLGKISYGLYVFHLLGLMLAGLAVRSLHALLPPVNLPGERPFLALAIILPLAFLSYRYLETPFLRLKEHFAFVASRAI